MKCSLYLVARSLTPLQGCALDVKQFRHAVRTARKNPATRRRTVSPTELLKSKVYYLFRLY